MDRRFEDLIAEAEAAPIEGWDFSWLDGRATEERPSWHYAEMVAARLRGASAMLDIECGGGERLSRLPSLPRLMVATEGWVPNIALAGRRPPAASSGHAGLTVEDLRQERLRTVFFDVGAVVYFLRLVVWIVPGFTVEKHRDRLEAMHEYIQQRGPFVGHAIRFLIDARKPARH